LACRCTGSMYELEISSPMGMVRTAYTVWMKVSGLK
jgi:hypothetical protein